MGYFSLIWKDFIIYTQGFTVYMNEGYPLAQNVYLETSDDSH